jgi:hypothetical protein
MLAPPSYVDEENGYEEEEEGEVELDEDGEDIVEAAKVGGVGPPTTPSMKMKVLTIEMCLCEAWIL